MGFRETILADLPVVYLRLGEVAGVTAADESGNGHDLTYAGAPTLGEPSLLLNDANPSVKLDGTTAQFLIRNPFAPGVLTNVTILILTKVNTAKAAGIVSYATAGVFDDLLILDPKDLKFRVRNTEAKAHVNIIDGSAHVIEISWRNSDGRVQFWLDGVLVSTVTGIATAGAVPSGGSLVLGQDQDSVGGTFQVAESFDGWLDEFAIFNTVLSDDRIKAHYAASQNNGLAPIVTHAVSQTLDAVQVYFSEPVANTGTTGNFTIPGCVVAVAVPSADRRSVLLTTTGMVAGTAYTVTVSSPPVHDDVDTNLIDNTADFVGALSASDNLNDLNNALTSAHPSFHSDILATPGRNNEPPCTHYVMRGYRALTPGLHTWGVDDVPDAVGNYAPFPGDQFTDITIVAKTCTT